VTPFTARFLGAVYLSELVGALILFAILGLVIVDGSRHQVDWTAPGTIVWLAAFAAFIVSGAGMLLWSARRSQQRMPVSRSLVERSQA
jgi:hypothetical protein